MGIPHFLVIPYPIPGHVNPLMQLSNLLSKHGCKITFLNTEYSHKRTNNNNEQSQQTINFVTLPDGLEHEDDRSDQKKVIFSIKRSMPALLHKLIEDVNNLDDENKISCIVVTFNMGWALEVGLKLGIKGVLFWTASATTLASCYNIPKLIHDGIIDSAGKFFFLFFYTNACICILVVNC
jgi:UDP:flavonoid glycosyltransferase YjiC (YdhE family)